MNKQQALDKIGVTVPGEGNPKKMIIHFISLLIRRRLDLINF